ncbi:hypothetical protein TUSST3_17110 [Streptomyces sp. TUS-ST3]|uniref:hypothetical protein n=1 Tax=Streptomyces sp. TUS-ST3 TaxID=3025591 RepID=UPI00235B39F6|nr:hypothetical protein [Streptomyces sp. TUS-ST3]GLP65091.1 hypothetical protein TUSST3_17110 [Streptomyces sp. TUS-ST3]
MHLRKRVLALVFVAAAAFTALGPQAMAAPMPWETSKTPTSVTHHSSTAAGERGTVTVLCAPPCYQ